MNQYTVSELRQIIRQARQRKAEEARRAAEARLPKSEAAVRDILNMIRQACQEAAERRHSEATLTKNLGE